MEIEFSEPELPRLLRIYTDKRSFVYWDTPFWDNIQHRIYFIPCDPTTRLFVFDGLKTNKIPPIDALRLHRPAGVSFLIAPDMMWEIIKWPKQRMTWLEKRWRDRMIDVVGNPHDMR